MESASVESVRRTEKEYFPLPSTNKNKPVAFATSTRTRVSKFLITEYQLRETTYD